MSPSHFAVVALVCLIWAANTVLSKIVVAGMDVPPLAYAAMRYMLVALFLFPWLGKVPRPFWRMVVVAMLISGFGFAMFIAGMRDATPSSAGILTQIAVPATTILSVIVLGEVIRWRRITGIVLTLIGIVVLLWRPDEFRVTAGLWLILASSLAAAVGVIVIKQMEGVDPLQYQAWSGLLSILPLGLASFFLETGQIEAVTRNGWSLLGALLFVALFVSIVSHSLYYWVIQRHDANLIAPLMIMNPLFCVILGIWITGDTFTLQMSLGAALALIGVLIISVRPNTVLPLAMLLVNRWR